MVGSAAFCASLEALACQPTAQEQVEIAAIQSLQARPIWLDFPANYHFAVREFDSPSKGFFVVQPGERNAIVSAGLGLACEANGGLLQSATSLEVINPGFFPGCGSESISQGCRVIPQLLDLFNLTQKANGTVGITKDVLKRANSMFPKGTPYTRSQVHIYHAIHEMFHELQTERKYKTSGLNKVFWSCVENNPIWARKYAQEKKWWSRNFSNIHLARRDRHALQRILREFYSSARPTDKLYPDCQEAQAQAERHEGVAHFVGSLALLRSGLADEQDLARIDRRYFEVAFADHNVMGTYATGGGLSWLLYYLMGEEAFITQIESGLTPYEIGRSLLLSPQ